jgi:2-polyprenyl-6-methoxyphenol hydroxylase-like FAD-dependent oxidoreductase
MSIFYKSFILLGCPQYQTEKLLKDYYLQKKGVLIKGVQINNITNNQNGIKVEYLYKNNKNIILSDFLVGCDGRDSFIRNENTKISIEGKEYPDTFLMGDFEDNTNLKDGAAIFMSDKGLVESFPMPNGLRRWVVSTEEYISKPEKSDLTRIVKSRTKTDISE